MHPGRVPAGDSLTQGDSNGPSATVAAHQVAPQVTLQAKMSSTRTYVTPTKIPQPTKAPHPTTTTAPITTTTTSNMEISGGDIYHCLSASDIDSLVNPLLGQHVLPARFFYDVRTGRTSASLAERTIRSSVSTLRWLLAPVHVRHHWASALIYLNEGSIETAVYDSCPSPITRRDFRILFQRLHLGAPNIRCIIRQPAHSNECGLHVVLMALLQNRTDPSLRPFLPHSQNPPFCSLSSWRPILAENLHNRRVVQWKQLEQEVPHLTNLIDLNSPSQPPPLDIEPHRSYTQQWTFDPYGGGKKTVDKLDRFRQPRHTPTAKRPITAATVVDSATSQHDIPLGEIAQTPRGPLPAVPPVDRLSAAEPPHYPRVPHTSHPPELPSPNPVVKQSDISTDIDRSDHLRPGRQHLPKRDAPQPMGSGSGKNKSVASPANAATVSHPQQDSPRCTPYDPSTVAYTLAFN